MAIQVVRARERAPSTANQFAAAFGNAVGDIGSAFLRNRSQKEQEARQQLAKQKLLESEYALKGDLKAREYAEKYANQKKLFDDPTIAKYISPGREQAGSQLRGETQNQEAPAQSRNELIPEEAIYKAEAVGMHGVAQQMRESNKQVIAEKHHEEKLDLQRKEAARKERLMSPEYQRDQQLTASQAKIDTDYNKQLQQSASQHKIKTETLNNLESLNERGVTGKPYEKILEKTGLVAYTSAGRREFAADVKNLITDIRSILGAQFTGFEFQTILNAYPSADFSQEANRAIIKNLKTFQDIRHQELEIAKQLKQENKGKIPLDFQAQVNERLEKYAAGKMNEIKSNTYQIMKEELGIPKGNVLMFSPDGEPLDVSADEVEKYESIGATIFPVGG